MPKRRRFAAESLDLTLWPTVAHPLLPDGRRERYQRWERAIQLYAANMPIEDIATKTGVQKRQLYRLLDRCLSEHPDGRIFGFRGLIPFTRRQPYERRTSTRRQRSGPAGFAGAFRQLLYRHPELVAFLRRALREHRIILLERGGRSYVRGLGYFHGAFLDQCRRLGLSGQDYPFTHEQGGVRSLSGALKRLALESFEQAARSAGAEHTKAPWPTLSYVSAPVATEPYEAVEFDGHRIDVRLTVLDRDPYGFEQRFELERIWLLVVIDVFTRAVLGYHLALAREYNRHDVVRAIEKTLEPHVPRTFVIPDLAYGAQSGFPSQRFPELAYGCWTWFRLDNARAHLAADALKVICEELGCIADIGPYHDPDERPFVERFFGTVNSHLVHRLPATTGSHPKDIRRRLSDPGSDLTLVVTLDELEDLIEVTIANYNGAPHSGLNGRSPLEAIEYSLRHKHVQVRWLPEPMRANLCLLQSPHAAVVRGALARGIRPHVNFYGVRYSNPQLSRSPALLGQRLALYMNPDDLRTVRAYLPDGSELGLLGAARPWHLTPHSLRLRRAILKLKRDRQINWGYADDPVEVYAAYQRRRAGKKRRAANDLAEAHRQLRARSISSRTPQAAKPHVSAPEKAPPALEPARVTGVIKPRKLSIKPGFAC